MPHPAFRRLAPALVVAAVLSGCGAASGPAPAGEGAGPPEGAATRDADAVGTQGAAGGGEGGGAVGTGASGEPTDPGGGAARVRALLSGSSALDYEPAAVTGTTLDGRAFDAAAVDGPVVYWFWAPWCTVCRAESGDVAAAAATHEGEITFVGVAGLGPEDDMADFVAETGVGGFTHLRDGDGSLWARFGVVSQPSYVVVDADGDATLWPGGLAGEDLDRVTAALVG